MLFGGVSTLFLLFCERWLFINAMAKMADRAVLEKVKSWKNWSDLCVKIESYASKILGACVVILLLVHLVKGWGLMLDGILSNDRLSFLCR